MTDVGMDADLSDALERALQGVLQRVDAGDAALAPVDAAIVPTRFPSLDRALGGGLRRGDLVVLGADDGAGASALALAIALRVTPRAVLVTGEMHAERVHERALAMLARVPLETLRLGTLDPDERDRARLAARRLRERAPVVETLYRGGIAPVSAALDLAPTAPLVAVDGVEALLQADAGVALSRAEQAAALVLALKRFALERNVCVLLLAHLPALDRTRHDRRPRLADFGGAAVGTHADVVLGLFREEMYDAGVGVAGAAELLLLKHRDGALGYVDLYWSARFLRFEDVLDPDA